MKNKDETRKENSSHKPPQLIIYFFNGPSTHHIQLYIEPTQIFPKPPQTQHVIPLNCFMVRAQEITYTTQLFLRQALATPRKI